MRYSLRIIAILVLATSAAAGALWAQELVDVDGGGSKKLYPISANPDGTLRCKVGCSLLGPCC